MTSSKQDQNKTQSRKKISRGGYSVLPPSLRSLVLLHLVLQIKMLGTEGRFSIMDCYNKDKPMCQSNLFSKSLSLSHTHLFPYKTGSQNIVAGGKKHPLLALTLSISIYFSYQEKNWGRKGRSNICQSGIESNEGEKNNQYWNVFFSCSSS